MAIFASPAWPQNSGDTGVTLDSGTTAQLCSECSPRDIRFAVTPKSGFKVGKSENPKVVEVSFGNLRDQSWVPLFVPHWELSSSSAGAPVALIIHVDDRIRKAGNYDVLLNLKPASMPAAPRLKIQIIHPASKLEFPEKLIVNRTVRWPLSTDEDKMRLDVREASGASGITEVTAVPHASMLGTELVTGQIVLKDLNSGGSASKFIAEGQTRQLAYDLSGDFPLGTVAGSIRFLAPELTDPVTLSFEVRSRLTKVYILVAIILGLLISWLLKVYLHNLVALGEARSKGSPLLDRVREDLASHPDAAFQEALTPAATNLNNALTGADAAMIAQRTTELDQAWRAALAAFATHRQDAQTALDELRGVVESGWMVPPSVLISLAHAKQAPAGDLDTPHIQEQIAGSDPSGALTRIAELRRHLAGELRTAGTEWHDGVQLYLQSLATAQAGLPDQVVTQFATALTNSTQRLNCMNPALLVPDPAAPVLIQFLRDCESEYRAARELLKELRMRLMQEWTAFATALNLADDDVAADLKTELEALGTSIEAGASNPVLGGKELPGRLRNLQEAWSQVVERLIEHIPDKQRENIRDLVQRRDFVGAAKQAAAAIAAHENVVLGDEQVQAQGPLSWPQLTGLLPGSPLTLLSSAPWTLRIPNALPGLHFRSLGRIFTAKGVQTLLVGFLFTVWAYNSYSHNYTGTWSELTGYFFGAFGLDLTVDAVFAKLKPGTAQ